VVTRHGGDPEWRFRLTTRREPCNFLRAPAPEWLTVYDPYRR
jgi:hypothetical protein